MTVNEPISEARVQEVAERMKREISAMVQDGVIPSSVRTFDELHDHIDANDIAGLCDPDDANSDIETDDLVRIQDVVHAWLQAGGTDASRA